MLVVTWIRKLAKFLYPYHRNWRVIVFGSALIAITVWNITISSDQAKTAAKQARDEAAHLTEIIGNADSRYDLCIASIPFTIKLNAFIEGDRVVRNTLVRNAKSLLDATPKGTRTYAIRRENWLHLLIARAEAFQVKIPVPTKLGCRKLRTQLLDGTVAPVKAAPVKDSGQ